MKFRWVILVCGVSFAMLMSGCLGVTDKQKSVSKKKDGGQHTPDRPDDIYESVLTYTGDGYDLPGGEKTEEIAKEHKAEVVKATKDYIKKTYKTDIEVHNMVGNKDGVTVFFESKGNLHFYSTAIVPINVKEGKVISSGVWTLEGEVEGAICAALYTLVKEEEFNELDQLLQTFPSQYPIAGRTMQSIENVRGKGHINPYYFIQATHLDEAIQPVYNLYLDDPNTSIKKLREAYQSDKFDPTFFTVSIHFFMKEKDEQPDREIFDEIVTAVDTNQDLPAGTYSIYLHDHYVIKSNAAALKDNSLSRSDYIRKD